MVSFPFELCDRFNNSLSQIRPQTTEISGSHEKDGFLKSYLHACMRNLALSAVRSTTTVRTRYYTAIELENKSYYGMLEIFHDND